MTNEPTSAATASATRGGERADFVEALRRHRDFLRFTVKDVTDDQARQRTTVSELTLGGLVKHVATTEKQWAEFIVDGPAPRPDVNWDDVDWQNPPEHVRAFMDSHRMTADETLEGLLAQYDSVAASTDELVLQLPDLDHSHPLPEAPWFEPGATWSARRALLHILAETSQHAGHADIIREALDGQKTMG
ncbi:Protein of unknown function [Pedococcus dokdonensis]|uniref:DinB superfamily protein n=1 Tax=Pedococcus dokdonensis TaxID=443156 RepID=A0A1H0N3Y3_9MICO|nr:DinB family protein [Pedococcus dokdonensis]SDO87387.1 Protein of unknown function [Pedococcus dokdonensis]